MYNTKIKLLYLSVGLFVFVFLCSLQVNAATAPDLKEGSYLTGQTLSVWPSWSTLGNAVGVSLPTDPINQLAAAGTCLTHTNIFCLQDSNCPAAAGTTTPEACVLHDSVTGWSVANRRFSFACSKDSYAYRYIASTTPGVYTVRAHFEDTGLAPANNNSFIAGFVSTSIFKINDSTGICNQDQEIDTMQSGTCGDGRLNAGEQCDPPGKINYGVCGAVQANKIAVQSCNSSCQWVPSSTPYLPCSALSKCGNGILQTGEVCDDGVLNGGYNKCNTTCTGKSSQYCGDGVLQSAYEVCDPGTPDKEKYALDKNNSCSWDCQNWGSYCGDKITQTQYGEECDGTQSCTVDGKQGVKTCTSNCLKTDSGAAAWWRFEQITGNQTADGSVNGNTATCSTGFCPKLAATSKYGNAFAFTQNLSEPRYLSVPGSASLTPTTSLTVEAWIYPTNSAALYQRIIEKGGPSTGKGYDLEFNVSSPTPTMRFNLWNTSQTSVDSQSAIPLNAWTHVVGTYQRSGTSDVAKIYINGVLENTITRDSATPMMAAPSTGSLLIGKSADATANNYFFGNLDEIKIYNRVLSADAVSDNYQTGWYCAVSSTPIATTAPGTCGDNVVNTNEQCDRGVANNGRACVPTYGTPCSYCSADCQNTIDVQPTQYCGNGIVESSEKCEVAGDAIYANAATAGWTLTTKDIAHNGYQELACAGETTATHTIEKGTKTCADCGAGVVRNCVKCGLDANGVIVQGGLVNVLDNALTDNISHVPVDPLFARKLGVVSLSLSISQCLSSTGTLLCPDSPGTSSPLVGRVIKVDASNELDSYELFNPYTIGSPPATLASDPSCSVGDTFNDKYQMYINKDWTRPLSFSVAAEPQSWQYDMVLSPVVSSTLRAKDVRVVVSWIGSGDFYSGVLNPFVTDTPQIEGLSYASPNCPPGSACSPPITYKYATGVAYYNSPASFKKTGVWYHGFNSTPGQTSAEAFTIDTGAMTGNTYSFYVRAPSYPIRTFKNTARLKVEVYLPENDTNQYHFGTPVKTYYLQSATPSDNQNARYWQVFNINEPSSNLSISDIIDINTLITGGPNDWQYTSPLVANSTCTNADWSSSVSPIPCPSTGKQINTWTKLSNCTGGVQHPATETVSCTPTPIFNQPSSSQLL